MKKIDSSNVTSVSRQPFLGRSITHLKEGIMENDDSLAKAIINKYVANDVIILWGCLVTTGSPTAAGLCVISSGAVYYNGEIYQVSGFNAVITGANVVVGNIVTTYQSGDPVTMTDGSLKNVHQIITINLSQGSSGSGIKDFSAMNYLCNYSKIAQQITLATQATTSGTYVDLTGLTYTTPNDSITRRWKFTIKGVVEINAVSAVGSASASGRVQIYNSTGAASLDVCKFDITIYAAGVTDDVVSFLPINCATIVTLAPNTTVKGQFLNTADGVTAADFKYIIEEI